MLDKKIDIKDILDRQMERIDKWRVRIDARQIDRWKSNARYVDR